MYKKAKYRISTCHRILLLCKMKASITEKNTKPENCSKQKISTKESCNILWTQKLLLLICLQLTSFPMRSLWFSMIPHGGIPTAQIFLRCGEARPFSASPTCLETPKQVSKPSFFFYIQRPATEHQQLNLFSGYVLMRNKQPHSNHVFNAHCKNCKTDIIHQCLKLNTYF